MNHEIFEIKKRLLPVYYRNANLGKAIDDSGLEKTPDVVDIDQEGSFLNHICNLFKIQFYFLLRYGFYNSYKDRETEMDDNLTLSVVKFF